MKKFNIEEFEFSQSYLFFWDKVRAKTCFLLSGPHCEVSSCRRLTVALHIWFCRTSGLVCFLFSPLISLHLSLSFYVYNINALCYSICSIVTCKIDVIVISLCVIYVQVHWYTWLYTALYNYTIIVHLKPSFVCCSQCSSTAGVTVTPHQMFLSSSPWPVRLFCCCRDSHWLQYDTWKRKPNV